ncbi:MAG: hypothetical protein J5878_03125, partial [Oscillospiraceae bacterium]|nr:hypothetical protein [Oscillospiraceae bacterium]
MIADLLESIDFNIDPLPFVTLFIYFRIITYRTGIVQKKKRSGIPSNAATPIQNQPFSFILAKHSL